MESKLSVKFQRIDGGVDDVILDKKKEKSLLDADGRSESANIADKIKHMLSIDSLEVEAKSLASDSVPAFVVFDESVRRMREYLAMTHKEMPKQQLLGKHTFVVNTNNSLVMAVCAMHDKEPELSKELATHIYELSLLSQKELHPEMLDDFINRTKTVLEKLTLKAVDSGE